MAFSGTYQRLTMGTLILALSACASTPDQSALNTAAPAPITAQQLVGATPITLRADFGAPELQRVEGPAQVWLYHSAVCGLNVILFTGQDGIPRVAEAVPNGDPERCMQSLQRSGLTDAALDANPPS
jgi:hypothetical protein